MLVSLTLTGSEDGDSIRNERASLLMYVNLLENIYITVLQDAGMNLE